MELHFFEESAGPPYFGDFVPGTAQLIFFLVKFNKIYKIFKWVIHVLTRTSKLLSKKNIYIYIFLT